ncbi:MAG: phospholipase D family protein, partial [Lacunisphaera sp.]
MDAHKIQVLLSVMVLGALLLAWSGCVSRPSRDGIGISHTLSVNDEGAVAKVVERMQTVGGVDHTTSGVHLLDDGPDAFAARISIVRMAQKSIDVQYYLYHQDATGMVFSSLLWEAANRGVRVRLLVDDLEKREGDFPLTVLDAHPNIEVRLFNPYYRRQGRWWQMVTGFLRLNHRMHNKSLTVDNRLTIVGGRNLGDEYFAANQQVNFRDLDVLAAGPVVKQVSAQFDDYWNCALAFPLSSLKIPKARKRDTARVKQEFMVSLKSLSESSYLKALQDTHFDERMRDGLLPMVWAPMSVWSDEPNLRTLRARADDGRLVIDHLLKLFRDAKKSLFLVSPYFVPERAGTAILTNAASKGVEVVVVTNSLASNDVVVTHSGYAKRRRNLLEGGVQLFETKDDPTIKPRIWSLSSRTSLHAKTYIVDERWVFIGSFNLDPRSAWINTEMGIVIDSPQLAKSMIGGIKAKLDQGTYQVVLKNG